MTSLYEQLTAAVEAQDPNQVVRVLRGVRGAERRVCSKPLQARLRRFTEHPAVGIAALGVAQNTAQALRAVNEGNISDVTEQAYAVLAERRPGWLADFSRRAVDGQDGWLIVRALVRAGLVPTPDVPAYITRLPLALNSWHGTTLRDTLLADPGLLEFEVFQLFAVEGAGEAMRYVDGWHENHRVDRPKGPERTWRVTLARLCDDGHLDRGRILDACLGAFLTDGTRPTWFAGFHAELAPGEDEICERTAAYLKLLQADAGVVVGLAQRALAVAVKAGRVGPADLVEASAPVLHRAEKKYVLGQLRLMSTITATHPALAPRAAELAAIALTHDRVDVAEKALDFIERWRRQLDDGTLSRIKDTTTDIAPSLHDRAGWLVGPPDAEPDAQIIRHVTAAPSRVQDLHELADVTAALVADPWEPEFIERMLDGLARFNADHDAFIAALAPIRERVLRGTDIPHLRTLSWLLRPGSTPADLRRRFRTGYGVAVEPFWNHDRPGGASPGEILGHRLHEAYGRYWSGEPAPLLAFPDTATGQVDPARLVADLARLEDQGHQPWPADFGQSLLRVPRQVDDQARKAARTLGSPAGRMLADLLDAGGAPDPQSTLRMPAVALHGDPLLPPYEAIWNLPDPAQTAWYPEAPQLKVWAWALPSHREVVAAHAIPVLSVTLLPVRVWGPTAQFVAGLPETDGRAGPATCMAVLYALSAHYAEDRAAGVEALIGFAANGALDETACGDLLGTLAQAGKIKLGRIADGLTLAARSGAPSLVWNIVRAALPTLLTADTRDTHRLLALAADTAVDLGIRAEIEELTPIAARSGTTRLIAESRRLKGVLGGGGS